MAESLREQDVYFDIAANKKEADDENSLVLIALDIHIPRDVYSNDDNYIKALCGIVDLLIADFPNSTISYDIRVLTVNKETGEEGIESFLFWSKLESSKLMVFEESNFVFILYGIKVRIEEIMEKELTTDWVSSLVVQFKMEVNKDLTSFGNNKLIPGEPKRRFKLPSVCFDP